MPDAADRRGSAQNSSDESRMAADGGPASQVQILPVSQLLHRVTVRPDRWSCGVWLVEWFAVRRAEGSNEPLLRERQYEAICVPPGEPPARRTVVDEPEIAHYYHRFGDRTGDVEWIAERGSGELIGAAWVRLLTAEDPGFG